MTNSRQERCGLLNRHTSAERYAPLSRLEAAMPSNSSRPPQNDSAPAPRSLNSRLSRTLAVTLAALLAFSLTAEAASFGRGGMGGMGGFGMRSMGSTGARTQNMVRTPRNVGRGARVV